MLKPAWEQRTVRSRCDNRSKDCARPLVGRPLIHVALATRRSGGQAVRLCGSTTPPPGVIGRNPYPHIVATNKRPLHGGRLAGQRLLRMKANHVQAYVGGELHVYTTLLAFAGRHRCPRVATHLKQYRSGVAKPHSTRTSTHNMAVNMDGLQQASPASVRQLPLRWASQARERGETQ
jgi:hypothetical protein